MAAQQHSKRNFLSSSAHAMFYLLYKHQFEIPNYFTLILFCIERCNFCCSHSNCDLFTCDDNRLFSRVKIFVFV